MSEISSSIVSSSSDTGDIKMASADLLPKCDPDEAGFRVKDYFLDLESYFTALKINENAQKQSFLQLSLSKKAKSTLADLFYPDEFSEKTYKDVKDLMVSHYADKKMLLVYREKFNQRVQQDGETCKQYFDSLRELARMCDYTADFYKQQMYDRSIAGLSNEIWKANLSMKDRTKNTYSQIQDFALQYEEHKQGAEKLRHGNSAERSNSPARATTVGNVAAHHKPSRGRGNNYHNKNKNYHTNEIEMCYRCQRGRHNPQNCWHKNAKCEKCGKIGHLTRVHKDPANWQHGNQKGAGNGKPKYYSKHKNNKK